MVRRFLYTSVSYSNKPEEMDIKHCPWAQDVSFSLLCTRRACKSISEKYQVFVSDKSVKKQVEVFVWRCMTIISELPC